MFKPINRVNEFLPAAPPEPALSRLLAAAHGIKLELLRYEDSDGDVDTVVSYEVHGTAEDDGTLAALLAQFRQPRREGGVA